MKTGDAVMTPDGPGRIAGFIPSESLVRGGRRVRTAARIVVALENDGRRKDYPVPDVEPLAEFA